MVQGIMLSGLLGKMSAVIFLVLAAVAGLAVTVASRLAGGKKIEEKDKEKQKISLKEEKSHEKEKEDRRKQIQLLVSLREQAENAEREVVYSQLFGRIGGPVQKLFALAEQGGRTDACERMLREEIQEPIKEAARMFQVSFTAQGLFLPAGRAETKQENPALLSRLEKLSDRDIADEIRKCQERAEGAERYRIPKEAVSRSAVYLHRLTEMPAAELKAGRIKEVADEIKKAFIQSGIYPLFQDNEKLEERPDLRGMFIEVQGGMPRLPGFFIESGGKLQLYGNFQGTCYR